MTLFSWFSGLFGRGNALADKTGAQTSAPASALVSDTTALGPDSALQIGAVWACVERIAKTVSSLPLFVYRNRRGVRDLDRASSLWMVLHDSPNYRMTPVEFWTAMLMNLLLRGNAYARIERNAKGEAFALWPMSSDQVEMRVLDDGSAVYLYRIGDDLAVLAEDNVLHIKEMGNGTIGLARLDYMRSTTTEATNSQSAASKLFGAGGKPTGVLMVDNVLNPAQREKIKANFAELQSGNTSRLFVLEANMKYQQLSLSPEDQQLLETRQFTVEEIGRWFGVPAVLINHSNVTAWGSGIEQIVEGFYKLTIRPLLVNIEQAITKRVLTAGQRAEMTVEFGFDALLRSSLKDRAEIYAKLVQNGIQTRNECRQLENLPPVTGGDELTAQTNLAPLQLLGAVAQGAGNAGTEKPLAQ
jgi:HK97 family phage portal protein